MARTADPNSKKPLGVVMVRPDDRTYLALWAVSITDGQFNPSEAIEELIDRCKKVWPGGPNSGPPLSTAPKRKYKKPVKKIQAYAAEHGLSRQDAEARLLQLALKETV